MIIGQKPFSFGLAAAALTAALCIAPAAGAGTTQYMDSAFGLYTAHSISSASWFRQQMGWTPAQYYDWVGGHYVALGAHWDRSTLQLRWDDIEPTLGAGYVWDSNAQYTDSTIIHTYTDPGGVHLLACFLEGGGSYRNPMAYTNEYAAFVRAAVERYDGDGNGDADPSVYVKWWQVGNEFPGWTGSNGRTVNDYVSFVRLVRNAALASDPGAKIVLIGSMYGDFVDPSLTNVIRQLAPGREFDAIDIHYWETSDDWKLAVVPTYRSLLDSLGLTNVQIWSCENATWVGQPGSQQNQTEEDQARSLIKRYVWNRANGLDKLMWEELLDFHDFNGQTNNMFNSMGLVSDGQDSGDDASRLNTERVSYWAYQLLASKTDNGKAHLVGTVSGVNDSSTTYAWRYTRDSDGGEFFILWRESGSATVNLPVTGAVYSVRDMITDRFGTVPPASNVTAGAGVVHFTLGTDPLLIEQTNAVVYGRPVIVVQPRSATNNPGAAASFLVAATGQTFYCQWQKNGTNISGATSTNYSLAAVAESHEGSYRCVVTNLGGSVTSATAVLIVNNPPTASLTTPPNGAVYGQAPTIALTASATDTDGTVTQVTFYADNVSIATVTNGPFTAVWSNAAAGSASLTARAWDNLGLCVTSAPASVTVYAAPTITSSPASRTNGEGESCTFTVGALSVATLYYQWQKNTTNLAGAGSASYTISALAVGDAGSYRCVVTNLGGGATSGVAVLTVDRRPTVSITNPTNGAAFVAPSDFALVASASDTDGSVTQVTFYANATWLGSDTSSPYTCAWSSVPTGTYAVTAVAWDNLGLAATSAAASVTLCSTPAITASPASLTNYLGRSNVFTVVASGGALSYQWQKGGTNIGGATSAGYIISALSLTDAGSYRCVVTNVAGMATSGVAVLTVTNAPGQLDLNNDGNADILLQSTANGALFSWYLNGHGTWTNMAYLYNGSLAGWSVVGTADYNSDGNADILLQSTANGALYAWYLNGHGSWTNTGYLYNGSLAGWSVVGTADYNNDGNADILLQSTANGALYAWYLNGHGSWTNTGYLYNGSLAGWNVAGGADYNNDGNADILLQSTANGALFVWYMNGHGTWSSMAYLYNGSLAGWNVVGTGDYNSDGNADILLQSTANGALYVWYMDGHGGLSNSGYIYNGSLSGWNVVGGP